jgi:eukaryotic-like serine/threonine-protein kinase
MLLAPGTKLGPYEIVGLLGAGGMGEVYRAKDTRLGRDVAIKILPEVHAGDALKLSRFEREAQLLAALNHPNIAAIYGVEEWCAPGMGAAGGPKSVALVMECVDGRTIAEQLQSGPMPLDEILGIAKQIAEGLEYAHEHGIIHRDLKPANIKINEEGTVKLLDFGLAKVLSAGISEVDIQHSPTISLEATRAGVILGTAAYMSPEQAKGRPVDKRTDIWAFGCVLYEMATRRVPFRGESVSDTLASVMRDEPDWAAFPAECPKELQGLVRRCLAKDPKHRLRDAGDARNQIEEILTAPKERTSSGIMTAAPPFAQRKRGLMWAGVAAGALVLAAVCLVGVYRYGAGLAAEPTRWTGDLLGGPPEAFGGRISPDGRTLAFQAMIDNNTQVAVMNVESGNWTVLTHDRTRGYVTEISWSRDGSRLYYDRFLSTPQGVYTVPALGGEEQPVLEEAYSPEALPDGSLLVVRVDSQRQRRKGVFRYWPIEGKLQELKAWPFVRSDHVPVRVSTDGKHAMVFGWTDPDTFSKPPGLHVADLTTNKWESVAANLQVQLSTIGAPMSFTADGRGVLVDVPAGNLHVLTKVATSGAGNPQVVLTLTKLPGWVDVGPDGAIYLDQVDRPEEILRFTESGGAPEVIATSESFLDYHPQAIQFADGRFLMPTFRSGRARLMVGKPGGNFSPLLDNDEQTAMPAALLPNDELAFVEGIGPKQEIVIVAAREGRIIRHLKGPKHAEPFQLAGSADGKTLYYVADGTVWAIPVEDGEPRKICQGDAIAVDPNGKDLIVSLNEMGGVRLNRVSLSGGTPSAIRIQENVFLNVLAVGGGGVRSDGKIVVGVMSRDSWFYENAILDPVSGQVKKIPLNYRGDVLFSGWAKDGQIISFGYPMRARLWRFRTVKAAS